MHQTVTGKCKSTEDLALQFKICNLIRDGPLNIKGETGIFFLNEFGLSETVRRGPILIGCDTYGSQPLNKQSFRGQNRGQKSNYSLF